MFAQKIIIIWYMKCVREFSKFTWKDAMVILNKVSFDLAFEPFKDKSAS
jgi:hypothetical protein